ncbi:MAG TPA: hypothetical protein VGG29_15530 [Caulobacteraceae bacterium]
MADIAISRAAFAGFGLLRRRPWVPLIWATIYAGVIGLLIVLLGGAFIQAIGRLVALRPNDHAALGQVLALMGGIFGGYVLFLLVFWVLGAVVNMAVVRAVMEPEARAYAYLRLGVRELWLMLANFVLFILYVMLSMAMAIPVGVLSAVVALNSPAAAPFVSWPLQIVTWIASIWLGLRFCMVAPMIYADRRFRLFESWSFTRGHVWRLFQVGLIMVASALILYVLLLGVGFAVGIPLFMQMAQTINPHTFFTQAPAQAFRQLSPILILYVGLIWAGFTVLLSVFFAPWPAAYRQLVGDDLAATFS